MSDTDDRARRAGAALVRSVFSGRREKNEEIHATRAALQTWGEAAAYTVLSAPDPRDARIAELEAALAGLVDALPRCDKCTTRGTTEWSGYGQSAIYCDEHLGYKSGSTLEWDCEAEIAERALGRRK